MKNILTAILFLGVALIGLTQISDYDFWWHLNLGRTIYETGMIDFADSFSYTHAGKDQFNGEWLSDLLFFIFFKIGGYEGIAFLKIIIVSTAFFFLLKAINITNDTKSNTWFFSAVITLLFVLLSIRFRLFVRPFLFSYLFLSVFLYVILHWLKHKNIKYLFMLLPIELVWANTSKGFFFGPVILFIFFTSEILLPQLKNLSSNFSGRWVETNKNNSKNINYFYEEKLPVIIGIGIGIFLISLINIEFYSLYVTIYENLIWGIGEGSPSAEHAPLSSMMLWGYGLRYTYAFQILFLGSLLSCFFINSRKNLFYALLFIIFLVPALKAVRMIDFFSIITAPIFVRSIDKLFNIINKRFQLSFNINYITFSGLFLFIIALTLLTQASYSAGTGPNPKRFPLGAVRFLENNNIQGRIFNSYPFGGYLAWQNPQNKVFIDGRANHLYEPDFVNNIYIKSLHDDIKWKDSEAAYNFEIAVFEYELKSGPIHFPIHIHENQNWALVYWDEISTIYLKRLPKYAEIIEKNEYTMFKPKYNDFSYLNADKLRQEPENILLQKMNREIQLNTNLQEPRLAKAFTLFSLNSAKYQNEISNEILTCLKLSPDLAMEHSAAAFIYFQKGLVEEGKKEVKKALDLDSNDENALYLKKKYRF
ncbi:MAG: hypothetical protein OEZ13_12750 [Spirochaetia bacterium]|nr:hypothetical protein [Spirochaetia bacterium]